MNDTRRPTTLREVAQLASLRHGGKGGRALARAAEKLGHKTTHTTLDNVLQGRYQSRPSDDTLRVLAALAGMEDREVFELADRPSPLGPLVDDLPEGSDALTRAQRDALASVVRQFVDLNEALHGGREDVMGNAEHPAPTTWAAGVVTWVDQVSHQAGRPINAELRRARNVIAHSQPGSENPEYVMAAFKLAQTELQAVLAMLTATLDPGTNVELGDRSDEPGPFDEDLDALESEAEAPTPYTGGHELSEAARRGSDDA